MAILEKTAPNGQIIEFDTNEFSEQEMEQYLNLPKFKKELPQVNQQQEETRSRNIVTDIGLSAIDGVRDGVQASIGLVEQIGDTLGETTNVGVPQAGCDSTNAGDWKVDSVEIVGLISPAIQPAWQGGAKFQR